MLHIVRHYHVPVKYTTQNIDVGSQVVVLPNILVCLGLVGETHSIQTFLIFTL